MKVSLRVKLVLLLVVVALLPLMAAVLTIVLGGRHYRTQFIGGSAQAMALSEASILRAQLAKDIEKLHLAFNEDTIRTSVARSDKALRPDELAALDAAWPTMPETDRRLSAVVNNPAAVELRRFQAEDPRLAEAFVTDHYGQLVAATGRTDDFYQADEAWWQGAENNGQPRVFVPPVSYDTSSHVWSIDLCIPIMSQGQMVGVGKAVLNISQWLEESSDTLEDMGASVTIVEGDGKIIYGEGVQPLAQQMEAWEGPIAQSGASGWRLLPDGQVQAFVRLRPPSRIGVLNVQAPEWTVVISLARSRAMQSVLQLSLIVLGVGLAIIAVIFLIGLYLVNHFVVARVYRLHAAARQVADGDLGHRIAIRRSNWRPLAMDELDDLAEGFNRMVDQIKRGYEELAAANQLKMKFIRIAGHELRTPVSYILGMTRLLKDSQDPERLLHAIQTMGAKAKRLDEIIQAMFKLMPEQRYSEDLRYAEVSVSELLEEVYLDCFPFIEQRNQHLIIEGAERIATLQADREKLRDVIENLVLNAIKFTPDGGVIKIRVSHQLGNYGTFAVQDQGPGIPNADLPHIFEPFYSGGDVMQHSSGGVGFEKRGMGLGLAIVRHFVELHGGSVSVTTGPNGTIFTVSIPLEPHPDRQPPQPLTPPPPMPG